MNLAEQKEQLIAAAKDLGTLPETAMLVGIYRFNNINAAVWRDGDNWGVVILRGTLPKKTR